VIAGPWLLDGVASLPASCNGVVCGVRSIAIAIARGPIKDSYSGWDRYIV
jgi:hypothetical protein